VLYTYEFIVFSRVQIRSRSRSDEKQKNTYPE
jgi:hypothetical protein